MIGLTSLEVYNSFFNTATENKIELPLHNFEEFSFTEVKDDLEQVVNFPNNTRKGLQDKKLGPRILSDYQKLETGKRRTDGYYFLLMDDARSPFRDFECFPRIEVVLHEDDI